MTSGQARNLLLGIASNRMHPLKRFRYSSAQARLFRWAQCFNTEREAGRSD